MKLPVSVREAVVSPKKWLQKGLTRIVHQLEPRPAHWDTESSPAYRGPYIVFVHGYRAPTLAERHWFNHLISQGYQDVHLYSNHEPVTNIVTSLLKDNQDNRPVVLIGYSQGAFQVLKIARHLDRLGLPVELLVTMGAGGLGRLYPTQWFNQVRKVPKNVTSVFNFFVPGDLKGTDPINRWNWMDATSPATRIENIAVDLEGPRRHLDIARTSSRSYLPAVVGEQIVARVEQALATISAK